MRRISVVVGPRRRLLLDVDGPCANFTQKVFNVVKEETGGRETYTPDQVTTWDILSILKPEWREKFEKDHYRRKGFCRTIPVVEGAISAVEELRDHVDVHFVTSPMDTEYWAYERGKYLEEHFSAKPTEVVQTSEKHIVSGDYLVDDKVSHIEKWAEHHPEGTAFLWDMPYNRNVKIKNVPGKIQRVDGWADLLRVIRG